MNIKKPSIFLLVQLYGTLSHAYLYTQLQEYEASNQCINCDLTQMSLSSNKHNYSQLSGAYLVAVHINNFIANHSQLDNTNWVYALMERGEFNYSNFSGARFDYALIYYASYKQANFTNAHLDNAKLYLNDFTGADFTNASVKNANFSYSNLMGSNMTQAQLNQMKTYQCATLPDGSIFDNSGKISCAPTVNKEMLP